MSEMLRGITRLLSATMRDDMSTPPTDEAIRYEPDEPCPPLIALGVGLQGVMLVLATIVLIVAITARAGGPG